MTGSVGSDVEGNPEVDERSSSVRRIELQWPDKGMVPVRCPDGNWRLQAPSDRRVQIPFVPVERFAGKTSNRGDSLVIEGQRIDALSTLRRTVAAGIKLAYLLPYNVLFG